MSSARGLGAVEVDMTSSNFAQTIIGEATQDCVNKLAAIRNEQTDKMKANVREVETRVAAVSGGTVTIAAGANDGVNAGEVFEIFKVLGEIRDPQRRKCSTPRSRKSAGWPLPACATR